MIGGGVLEMSQEAMTEAVQEWLDKRWTVDSPVVERVMVPSQDRTYGQNEGTPIYFRVALNSNKQLLGVSEK